MATITALLIVLFASAAKAARYAIHVQARSADSQVRSYAHRLVLARWHSEAEWRALDTIVGRESSWNPCAHWYHSSDCGYTGGNSCGIPQANPCPSSWRGRLWSTRFAQVDWLIAYVRGRYGSPSAALAYWDRNHSY